MDSILWPIVSLVFIVYIVYAILKDLHTKVDGEYHDAMLSKEISKAIDEADRAMQESYQWAFDDAIITRSASNILQIYYDKDAHYTAYEFPDTLFVFWEKRPNAMIRKDEVIAYFRYEGYKICIKAPQQGRLIRVKGDWLKVNNKEIICEIESIKE